MRKKSVGQGTMASEKDYGILIIIIIASLIPLGVLFGKIVHKWRQNRAVVARDFSLAVGFLSGSMIFYLLCSGISFFDPWHCSLNYSIADCYQTQVWLYAFVYICQIIALYFIFSLGNELWPLSHGWIKSITQIFVIGLVIYIFLGALMGWGHEPFGNNNNDLIPLTYAIAGPFITLVALWGSFRGLKTTLYLRAEQFRNSTSLQSNKVTRLQKWSMLKTTCLFLGITLFNVLSLMSLITSEASFSYWSWVVNPIITTIAYGGLFPKRSPSLENAIIHA